jgi:hypothetical protein
MPHFSWSMLMLINIRLHRCIKTTQVEHSNWRLKIKSELSYTNASSQALSTTSTFLLQRRPWTKIMDGCGLVPRTFRTDVLLFFKSTSFTFGGKFSLFA